MLCIYVCGSTTIWSIINKLAVETCSTSLICLSKVSAVFFAKNKTLKKKMALLTSYAAIKLLYVYGFEHDNRVNSMPPIDCGRKQFLVHVSRSQNGKALVREKPLGDGELVLSNPTHIMRPTALGLDSVQNRISECRTPSTHIRTHSAENSLKSNIVTFTYKWFTVIITEML